MRYTKSLSMVISLLFIFSLLCVFSPVKADGENCVVDGEFSITILSGTYFDIDVEMDVFEVSVFDTMYTSAEISTIAQSDLETMGAIKLRLRELVKKQIESVFPEVAVTSVYTKPKYENSVFVDKYSVNLSASYFGLDEKINASDFINGLLDMDAVIAYSFDFVAEVGWNNTYAVILPEYLNRPSTNGFVNGKKITWEVHNWNGGSPTIAADLSLQMASPTTSHFDNESIFLLFELDTKNVSSTSFKTSVIAERIDIRKYNIVPDFISNIDFVVADGIRLLVKNGLLSWEDVYNTTIKNIESVTVSAVETSSFNQTLDTIFSWDLASTVNCTDPYSLSKMDSDPPVTAEFLDEDVDLLICDMPSRALFGLANIGATVNISMRDVNFGDELDEIGLPYTCVLYLPENILLAGDTVYSWDQNNRVSGSFMSNSVTPYNEEEVAKQIIVDFDKLDLNVMSVLSRNTELSATVNLRENIDIHVIDLPNEFSINDKILIDYIDADAIRLCIEEAVFDEEDVDVFLTNKKQLFEINYLDLLEGLEINGYLDRSVFEDSLVWDKDVFTMDGASPVIISSYAQSTHPVPFMLSFIPPSFAIENLSFTFHTAQNQSVVYQIIFPNGVSIDSIESIEKSIVEGKTSDGRSYFEVVFTGEEDELVEVVACHLSASPLFVLGLLLPCILSFILVIILLVVIYIIRKKKKRGKPLVVKGGEGDADMYDGQDFYVPPRA